MASSTRLVLLDTNFILSCYRFRIYLEEIDRLIDEVHKIVVPANVLKELNQLTLTGKDEEARKTMLKVLDSYTTLPLEGRVDTSLLEFAREHDCIICTNDKPLRKALRKMGIRTIFVRARSHLTME